MHRNDLNCSICLDKNSEETEVPFFCYQSLVKNPRLHEIFEVKFEDVYSDNPVKKIPQLCGIQFVPVSAQAGRVWRGELF